MRTIRAVSMAVVFSLFLAGCTTGGRRDNDATAKAAPPQSSQPAQPAAAAPAPTPAVDTAEKEKQKEKLERELRVANMNLQKTKLSQENQRLVQAITVEKLNFEAEMVKRRYQVYLEEELVNRIKRQELNMKWQRENVLESRQELEQTEKMYKDEEFADATKDIVVDRARRRLENAERGLAIAEAENRTLLEKTIPYEKEERRRAVEEKQRAIEQNQRDWAMGEIDRQIALINQEAEVRRLEDELKKVTDEIEKAKPAQAAGPKQETQTAAR